MVRDSLPPHAGDTNVPAPSPELPISVHLDGNIGAVDFIKRLHAVGLELRQGSDDDYAVITLAEPQPVRGSSVQLFTPQRAQQLLHAVSDTQSQLGQARSMLHMVIDSLPPLTPQQGGPRTANCLEAVITILDLAQQNASTVETYALDGAS